MRILIDTNILFSALLFSRSRLLYAADNHEIVLCDRNVAELRDILKRKAPKYLPDAEVLLAEISYELIPAVYHAEKLIRDAKDQPILNAAIVSDVDIILTGDKDFLSCGLEHPKRMTVAQFFESEGVEDQLPRPFSIKREIYSFITSLFSSRLILSLMVSPDSLKWTLTI